MALDIYRVRGPVSAGGGGGYSLGQGLQELGRGIQRAARERRLREKEARQEARAARAEQRAVEAAARAARGEQRQIERDAIMDERYAEGIEWRERRAQIQDDRYEAGITHRDEREAIQDQRYDDSISHRDAREAIQDDRYLRSQDRLDRGETESLRRYEEGKLERKESREAAEARARAEAAAAEELAEATGTAQDWMLERRQEMLGEDLTPTAKIDRVQGWSKKVDELLKERGFSETARKTVRENVVGKEATRLFDRYTADIDEDEAETVRLEERAADAAVRAGNEEYRRNKDAIEEGRATKREAREQTRFEQEQEGTAEDLEAKRQEIIVSALEKDWKQDYDDMLVQADEEKWTPRQVVEWVKKRNEELEVDPRAQEQLDQKRVDDLVIALRAHASTEINDRREAARKRSQAQNSSNVGKSYDFYRIQRQEAAKDLANPEKSPEERMQAAISLDKATVAMKEKLKLFDLKPQALAEEKIKLDKEAAKLIAENYIGFLERDLSGRNMAAAEKQYRNGRNEILNLVAGRVSTTKVNEMFAAARGRMEETRQALEEEAEAAAEAEDQRQEDLADDYYKRVREGAMTYTQAEEELREKGVRATIIAKNFTTPLRSVGNEEEDSQQATIARSQARVQTVEVLGVLAGYWRTPQEYREVKTEINEAEIADIITEDDAKDLHQIADGRLGQAPGQLESRIEQHWQKPMKLRLTNKERTGSRSIPLVARPEMERLIDRWALEFELSGDFHPGDEKAQEAKDELIFAENWMEKLHSTPSAGAGTFREEALLVQDVRNASIIHRGVRNAPPNISDKQLLGALSPVLQDMPELKFTPEQVFDATGSMEQALRDGIPVGHWKMSRLRHLSVLMESRGVRSWATEPEIKVIPDPEEEEAATGAQAPRPANPTSRRLAGRPLPE